MHLRLYASVLCLAGFVFAGSVSALSLIGGDDEQDEILPPEQAFKTSVAVADGKITVTQDIEDGYFVYKSKYRLHSDEAFIGSLNLPAGTIKQDQFFGEVETFRRQVSFDAEIAGKASAQAATITVTSQGCADIGICYPPMTEEFTVEVPASTRPSNSPSSGQTSGLGGLLNTTPGALNNSATSASSSSLIPGSGSSSNSLFNSLTNDNSGDVLDPEIAFTLVTGDFTDGSLPISWHIESGYYLYDQKFNFQILQPGDLGISAVTLSEGKLKTDEFFGEVEVHRNQAQAFLSFNNAERPVANAILKVGYQGCADVGICYPPQFKEINLAEIPASFGTTALSAGAPADTNADNQGLSMPVAEQDMLAAKLGSGKTITTILTFFGLGLLLTFTPCVLPMIPILSSIIVGSGAKIGTGKAFSLSLVYVLAMALTYTVAGVIIGLTGENIQATLQSPYVLAAITLLFVVLSASMFGLFELQMPAFVQNRLTNISNNQKSGSYAGVAIMGFLSALIVGPCVTAPLVGALIYIGQTGDAVLGGAALFALSMGMGLPILVIGTSFGKYLPTAGPWMDKIKAAFGFMLLGLAIWMLDRMVPAWVTMLLAAILLIMIGTFLGVFESKPADNLQKIGKGIGYASLVYGTLLLIGIGTGAGSLLKPLQGLTSQNAAGDGSVSAAHVTFNRIKSISDLESALLEASARNTPVIVDFYADWCVSCKEMEAFTFTDSQVAAKMNTAVLLQADVTANDSDDKALLRHYGIFGPPAIIFYNNEGVEIEGTRVVGFVSADKFLDHLNRVL